MSFNKVIVVGNLGRDPELRYTPQEPLFVIFRRHQRKRRDKAGEFQEITTWFKVTLWGKQAETASKYLTKGKPVYIEGRLRVEEYTDREGKNRYSLELNGSDMQFIGGGQNENASHSNTENDFSSSSSSSNNFQTDLVTPTAAPNDEDIPF